MRHPHRVGVPRGGVYLERLNTDSALYGSSNVGNDGAVAAAKVHCYGRPFSLDLTLPPLAALVFCVGTIAEPVPCLHAP